MEIDWDYAGGERGSYRLKYYKWFTFCNWNIKLERFTILYVIHVTCFSYCKERGRTLVLILPFSYISGFSITVWYLGWRCTVLSISPQLRTAPKETIPPLIEAGQSNSMEVSCYVLLYHISYTEGLVYDTSFCVDDYETFSDLSIIQPLSLGPPYSL